MRRFIYGLVCMVGIVGIQGCFWHSTTERDVVPVASPSSSTVVTPQGTTTTTTTQ